MIGRMLFAVLLLAGMGHLFQEGTLYAESSPVTSVRAEKLVNQNIRAWREKQSDLDSSEQAWMEITLAEVIEKAIQANPELRQAVLAVKSAGELQKETEASRFDPVLSLSAGVSRSESMDRVERDLKYKKATLPCPEAGDNIVLDRHGSLTQVIKPGEAGHDPAQGLAPTSLWICTKPQDGSFFEPVHTVFPPTSPVHYLRLNEPRPEGYYLSKEEASTADPKGATQTGTLSLGLSKALPWGVDVALNEETTHRDAQWVLNKNAPNPIVGNYDRPWSSSVVASVAVPVPGGKNFGRYGERDVAVELATLGQQQSHAALQSQANMLIQSVQRAYWDLVAGSRTLDATIESRHVVEQLSARTRRLFDLQRTTSYEMAQMDAERERVRGEEIVAWNRYVTLSNALKRLLTLHQDQSVLLMPVGYQVDLFHVAGLDLQEAIRSGHASNARLWSQEINRGQADLKYHQSENQTRPDLTLNASLSGVQSRGLFGYGSPQESITRLSDPDMVSVSVGATYRYPWGNQWARARLEQAESQRAMSDLQQRMVSNQVERAIKNSRIALDSALLRVTIAGRHAQLARDAYARAGRLHGAERLAEYELIVKSGELLLAEKALILAQVEAKKAEVELMAAIGSPGQDERVAKEYGP